MKQTKRIPALVLAIVCVLALCIGVAFAEGEANIADTKGPVITEIREEEAPANTIIVTAKIYDESGVYDDSARLYFRVIPVNPKDTRDGDFCVCCENPVNDGNYVFKIDTLGDMQEDLRADIVVDHISATDMHGNYTIAYPETTIQKTFNAGAEGKDYNPPVIKSFSSDKDGTDILYSDIINFEYSVELPYASIANYNYWAATAYIYNEAGEQIKSITLGKYETFEACDATEVDFADGAQTVQLNQLGMVKGTYTIKLCIECINSNQTPVISENAVTVHLVQAAPLADAVPTVSDPKLYVNGKQVESGEELVVEDSMDGVTVTFEAVIRNIQLEDNGFANDGSSGPTVTLYNDNGTYSSFKLDKNQIYFDLQLVDSDKMLFRGVYRYDGGDVTASMVNGNYKVALIAGIQCLGGYGIYDVQLDQYDLGFTLVDKYVRVDTISIVDEAENPVDTLALSIEKDYDKSLGRLGALVLPTDALKGTAVWSSSNDDIAVVIPDAADPNYVTVVGKAPGSCKLYAKAADDSEVESFVTVNVTRVGVDSVKLSANEVLLTATNACPTPEYQLTAVALPENAYDTAVTFTSSDISIAHVTEDGLIVATGKAGTCNIICTGADKVASLCKVSVENNIVVTDVILDKKAVELTITAQEAAPTAQLTATVAPEKAAVKDVRFTSSDEKVATVDQTGKITAVAGGTATISCTSANGISDRCEVTVYQQKVEKILLDKTAIDLVFCAETPDPSAELAATVLPGTARQDVEWVSEDTKVATVEDGVVTAVADGETVVYAKAADLSGVESRKVTVKVSTVKVASVTLNKDKIELVATVAAPNPSETLIATVAPANALNRELVWTSSNEDVAIVRDGKVIAEGIGHAVITVKSAENEAKLAQCIVSVSSKVIVEEITLNKYAASLKLGKGFAESVTLNTYVTPTTAQKAVVWNTTDAAVATVDENGVVTAVAPGTCEVYATATDGSAVTSKACEITVNKVLVEGLTLSKSSVNMEITNVIAEPVAQLEAIITPAEAFNHKTVWTTSNPEVATVVNGKVTAHSEGAAVITCTSAENVGISASCYVSVSYRTVVSEIKLSKSNIALHISTGDPAPVDKLSAFVYPASASITDVSFTSDNEAVAYVDEDGYVYGVGAGTCYITAASVDPAAPLTSAAVCKVVVTKDEVEAIYFTRSQVVLKITKKQAHPTKDLLRFLRSVPSGMELRLKWNSSNRKVATVKDGIVVARGTGSCTITATVRGTNMKARIKLIVK